MSRKLIAVVFRVLAECLASWLLVATALVAAESSAAQAASDETAASPAAAQDRPPWLGSKAGLGEEVLPPWTPVGASGGTVAVWGRSYTFGGLPLPVSVTARDKRLLASPIVLSGTAGGREIAWTAGATVTDQRTPSACELTMGSDSEQLKCEGKTRIEYDGMIRADLRLLPKTSNVTIERLDLEIPLRREHARYLHTWPGQWGSSGNSGALPADGYHGPLKPFVWLGDECRGLAWFLESDQGFAAAPGTDVLDIRPSGATVLMRVRLISKPMTISGPLEYTFGFQATPVKPAEPDAWDYRIVHMGNYGLESQPYQHLASIRYPAKGQWDLKQGTFECWVRPRFDPQHIVKSDDPGRGALNRNLLDVVFPGGRIGFYWNVDDRGMRVYFKQGEAHPLVFGCRADWRAGQWHHVAFTWGDAARIYLDGKKAAEQKYQGSIPGDLSAAKIMLGDPPCEMDIDEVRVSSVAREQFDLGRASEVDAQTLLLDHLDETFVPDGVRTTAPARGTGGVVSDGLFEAAQFGRGLCLSRGKTVNVLDQLASCGVRTICFHEHWTDIQNYTSTTREKELQSLVAACHERGIQLLLYFGYLMSDIAPEWNRYHEQCLVLPRTGDYQRQPKQTAYMVCYRSVWQDFLADGIDKMMERFGIDGVYLDGTSEPWACANTRHGCGYTKADGSIAATYPFFATREMMRRIYTIVKRHNPKGQVNVHQSTCMTIPTLSFATSYWDGEQLQGLAPRSNVFEVLPLESFRAEFMGHNWGVPAELLWYSGGPFRRGEAEAMAWLHDIPVRPSGMDDLATLSRLWTVRDEFGCHQATWLPYWDNEKYLRSSPAGVKVSLHNRPGQGLLAAIVNTGPNACQAEVALDLQSLQQPAAATAHNILTGKRLALNSGRVAISLGPLQYVILRLDP